MTGYEYLNYPAFRHAEAELRSAGYDVFNPIDSEQHNTTGAPQTWDWYMRHALAMLIRADGIALLPGWSASRGARLEAHVAHELGMKQANLALWLSGEMAS
jgi:hypothetical protein